MQFTTLTVACLSAFAASVSAQNAAAEAMTGSATGAAYGALTTTSTMTSTTTRTVSYAHTITRDSQTVASAVMPTGGYIGSNSTSSSTGAVSPVQPSSSVLPVPAPYENGAGASVVSHALVAALGLGAVAVVAL